MVMVAARGITGGMSIGVTYFGTSRVEIAAGNRRQRSFRPPRPVDVENEPGSSRAGALMNVRRNQRSAVRVAKVRHVRHRPTHRSWPAARLTRGLAVPNPRFCEYRTDLLGERRNQELGTMCRQGDASSAKPVLSSSTPGPAARSGHHVLLGDGIMVPLNSRSVRRQAHDSCPAGPRHLRVGVGAWLGVLAATGSRPDKTWFVVVLVVGPPSVGFLATLVYLVAGPSDEPLLEGPSASSTGERRPDLVSP